MTDEQEPAGSAPGDHAPDHVAHGPDSAVPPWARPVGAVVTGAFALGLLALAGFYLYELAIGAGDSPIRVVMSVVLFLIFAGAGVAMSRGWWRGATWPATPTLVIGVLFLPSAWTLIQSGSTLLGLIFGVVGILSVAVGWKGRTAPE